MNFCSSALTKLQHMCRYSKLNLDKIKALSEESSTSVEKK